MKLPAVKMRNEILTLIREGCCASGDFLKIRYSTAETDGKKFLISISRRCGNAVSRNRIRRIIREWCRKRYDYFSPGRNWMITVLPSVKNLSAKKLSPVLRTELQQLFEKCGEKF